MSRTGPPEDPGEIGAVICKYRTASYSRIALKIPSLTVFSRPCGLPAELLSPCSLGRLYVHEFTQDIELVALRVFAAKFQLRWDGEAFAFLILARHPRV